MSMLAEKKRREKWSLNPRGKAWSEDQNKFGQRLMEKMGWKAGQGLGANGQGQTDIVKARVKNDNKGLGFKENEEEWLKTTSDFEILLDKLASSQEDSGEGSQTDAPVSLEDRSKKSRARVHYHKFTRGKDISRYSEKDLVSIIGPDAVKLKNVQEPKSDYTENQINKGSLEEYFSKKTKSKDNKLVDITISEDQETVMKNSNTELRSLDENDAETEVAIPPKEKKKRKKGNSDESETLVNISIEDNENIGIETDKHDLPTEVSIKKKKKRKSGNSFDNSMYELDESDLNRLDSATSGSTKKVKKEKKSNPETEENVQSITTFDVSHSNDKISKNNKRKHEEYSNDIDNSAYLENSDSETKNDTDGKTMKIKKRKFDRKEVVHMELNEECTDNKLVVTEESIVYEETVSKKKKKRSNDGNKVPQEETLEVNTEYSEDSVSINPVVDQEAVDNDNIVSKKKKKKSKDENNKHQEDPLKVQTERNVKCTDINLLAAEEALDNDKVVSKKKKKKRKDENHENQVEYPLKEEQAVTKQKKEKIDKQFDEECTNETAPRFEKVVTPKKSGDFLEVLGRKTRLKNISIPKKAADSYQTEEFMSLGKSDNIEENISSKLKPVERPCIVNTDSENLTRSAVKNVELHKTDQTKIVENENSIIASCEKGESKLNNENANCFKCYAEINDDDCNVPKHLVAYEYRLVNARLKTLEITPPAIKVVNLESNTLNETTSRKLKQITKTRHLKCLLPPNVVTEIEASVSKFYDHLKPKIEIMAVLTELDDKIYEIAGNLDGKADTVNEAEGTDVKSLISEKVGKADLKVNEAEAVDVKSLISEKDGKADLKVNEVEAVDVKSLISKKVAGLTNLFQKLENLVENFRKTNDESSSSGLTHKEFPGAEDAEDEDQPESRLLWVKRVEDQLETLKEHVKMLAEGKRPPDIKTIRESQPVTRKKKKQPERFQSYSQKKLYQNKMYSRRRIAHNIGNQRGTEIQRGKLTAKSAVPSGDWGVLKSNISGKLPELNKKISQKLPELNKISGKLTKFNDESQKVSGGFGDSQGFMGRRRGGLENSKGFMGRGRGGLGDTRSFMGRGRGGLDNSKGFMGRGRGGLGDTQSFMGRGRGGSGNTRGFMGRGRGGFGDRRGRGGFGDSQGSMGRGRGGFDDSQGSMGQGRGGFGDSQGSMGRGRCGFGDSQGFIGRGGGGFGDSQGSIGRGGGFGGSQGFMGRGGGGLGDSQGFMGRGRGGFGANRGFMGRGRGGFGNSQGFMGRGAGGFGGSRGFIGHGRCDFRGRGRFDMRGRGRISQINFDAKQYAEKCKELNKLPEVCFNGVNLKVISGYAANVNVDQNIASCNNDSKSVGNQPNTKEISKAVAV